MRELIWIVFAAGTKHEVRLKFLREMSRTFVGEPVMFLIRVHLDCRRAATSGLLGQFWPQSEVSFSSSAEGFFYRIRFVVDDGAAALTQADVRPAVALWVRRVRLSVKVPSVN